MTRKADYFKTFCRVTSAFGRAVNKEALLELVVQSAVDTMNGKAACLFLHNDKENVFLPSTQMGLSADYLHASPMKAREITDALLEDGFLAFFDATSDPRLENHAAKKKEGIGSILTVPLRIDNRTIGVMSLYTADRREFEKDEIDFLCTLADHAALSIEKAALLDRVQKNALLFFKLASNINSSLDIREILEDLTVTTCQSLGMKGAVIRLLEEDGGDSLKEVASYGLRAEFLSKGRQTTTETARRALRGETLVIHDAASDSRVDFNEAMQAEGIVSMVVTPVMARDKVIGVMRLYSDVQREFLEDTLLMIKALAHQGGLAIQNASMHLKLAEDKKSLEEDMWSHRSWF